MLEVRKIEGRKELKKFVQFAIDLYDGNDCYVPPIIKSEVDILDKDVNPAFDFCESVYYMAYRDGKAVGRIAGFINHHANEKFGVLQCRFGFADFIDDILVSRALIEAVKGWGKSRGMKELVGPLGLTDLDYEGCLIEGFDQLSTSQTIYNFPYYRHHFETLGMERDATWNEYHFPAPTEVPEKHARVARAMAQRLGLHVVKETDRKRIVKDWGWKLFRLLNEAYEPLYGYTALTDRQIQYYIDLWLPQVRLDMIRLVADADNNLVAFGITCPSLSRAQQKARGKMWPFGWIHMAKAMYVKGGTDTVDLLLVAVRPDMQGKGVNAFLFTELIPQAVKNGYKWVETNPELVGNHKVQSQWSYFDPVCHKKRCTFKCYI